MILGCGVLFARFYFLIPGAPRAWDSILAGMGGIEGPGDYLSALGNASLAMVRMIFTGANLGTWRFWVFLYLSLCVAANIRLSLADIRGSLSGLGCIVLPFFLVNLVAMLAGLDWGGDFGAAAGWLGAVYGLLLLAFVLAVLGFVLVYPLAALHYRLRYRLALKPW
jgi:hypothetical protein